MSRISKQFCRECGTMGLIKTSQRIHPDLTRHYCKCKNSDCGHEWVAETAYCHTTKASKITADGIFQHLISKLPKSELEKFQHFLKMQLQMAQ